MPTIRLRNATGVEVDAVHVYLPTEGQGRVDFGAVGSGEVTEYREVPVAYRYIRTEVSGPAGTFEIRPYDYVGEEPLAEGRYTYRLGLIQSRLTVELEADGREQGPSVPLPRGRRIRTGGTPRFRLRIQRGGRLARPRASLSINSVFSQRTYPSGRPGGQTESQARDVDDCWCVSIFQCVDASCAPCPLPTIRAFRHAAGDPDDGKRDGAGSDFSEFRAGIPKAWPQLADRIRYLQDRPWSEFEPLLRQGWIASVAVTSSLLPAPLGFAGPHQVTVFASGDQPFIANPLQAAGSRPTPISWDRLRRAMVDYGRGQIYAVMFPPRQAVLGGTAHATAHVDEGGEMPIQATFRAGSGRATATRAGNAFDYVTRQPRKFDDGYVRNVVALATLEAQLSPSLGKGELMLVTTFGDPDRLEFIRAKDTDWPAGQSALAAEPAADCSAAVQRELEAAAQRAAAAIRARP